MYTAQVKKLIEAEYLRTGKAWIKLSRLSQLFYNHYGLLLVKEFFANNANFRIYRISDPSELYIALPTHVRLLERVASSIDTSNERKVGNSCLSIQPLPSIESCEDLEEALHQILDYLAHSFLDEFFDIQILLRCFYTIYNKQIESVINELISGINCVEFMQCSNRFLVQQAGKSWKIAISKSNIQKSQKFNAGNQNDDRR